MNQLLGGILLIAEAFTMCYLLMCSMPGGYGPPLVLWWIPMAAWFGGLVGAVMLGFHIGKDDRAAVIRRALLEMGK